MKDLMGYLPESYGGSPETRLIQEALGPEMEALWAGRDGLLAQLTPYSATWGLALWEEALGLATDESKPVGVRQRVVAAKIQGVGTTTKALVKSVAEQVLGVPTDVIERFSAYQVDLAFTVLDVLPPGMSSLKDILDEIMPAHLKWGYLITQSPTLYTAGHFTSYTVTNLPAANAPDMEG